MPSAASFPRHHSAAGDDSSTCLTCSITYDVLDGSFTGFASSYLANLAPGSRLRCSARGNVSAESRLLLGPKTPVAMVAAGTGIAPMRAFVQERAVVAGVRGGGAAPGPAVLLYGCRDHGEDFLYRDELAA